MQRILIALFFLIIGMTSFGQQVSVDTLFLPGGDKFAELHDDKLKFPLIKTGSLKIDKLINQDLKNRFTNNEFPEMSTDSTLLKWADNQIVFLDFEVTYLKNQLISINITAEGCGAYCTNWTTYFTYSLVTGKFVSLDEIVAISGSLKKRIISDKDKQYDAQREELKRLLLDEESGLDNETYKWALEHFDACDASFELNSYALYSDYFQIVAKCYLPNAIKNLTPEIVLKYNYKDVSEYLKKKLN